MAKIIHHPVQPDDYIGHFLALSGPQPRIEIWLQ